MSDGVIVDASVTLAWIFGEDDPPKGEAEILEKTPLVAPALWKIEVVNAVLVKERRKQLTEAQGSRFLNALESLDIDIVASAPRQGLEELALLARAHQLTAYDAVYLDLAIMTGLPLYTYDRNLQKAAKRVGVKRIVGS